MTILEDLGAIAVTNMPAHTFRLLLQRIGQGAAGKDLPKICQHCGEVAFPKDSEKARQVSDGFSRLLSHYSEPWRVFNDYKTLRNAYGHQLSTQNS